MIGPLDPWSDTRREALSRLLWYCTLRVDARLDEAEEDAGERLTQPRQPAGLRDVSDDVAPALHVLFRH